MEEPDFVDEMIKERTERNPDFPRLLDAIERRRDLLETLAEHRKRQGLTQTAVAAAMETSQSVVARLENKAEDPRLSTLDRYADVLGLRVEYRLLPL